MWDFFRATRSRSIVVRRCDECRAEIPVGESHLYCAGKVDGDFCSYRLCEACELITGEFSIAFCDDEGWALGETRRELRQEHGIDDALAWAVEARAARLEREAAAEVERKRRQLADARADVARLEDELRGQP